ncbi:uncharacterized protein LOC129905043 [Solanum dulcamara]|uniref:uncharacterized protein LOC129905043 n=1 Tax=Solanum dulcamara TaxID=45834 RepID=UPI0024859455|nr:uncharacterized protein LOC129905043 [Solanum dulcamara]
MRLGISEKGGVMANIDLRSIFIEEIKAKQFEDVNLNEIRENVLMGKAQDSSLDAGGVLNFRERICVLQVDGIIQKVLSESHGSRYSIQPGVTKIYQDLKCLYWWPGMKKDIAELTKSAHFIPVRMDYNAQKLTKIYVKEIIRLHGVPLSIILHHGMQFIYKFWEKLHEELGTQFTFNTAFNPQKDGQSVRTIQG